MSSGYTVGDVILVHFPFKDDPRVTKLRPAVVVEITEDPFLLLVQITGTNHSDQMEGRWIAMHSSQGKMMGLKKDSFLNYGNFMKIDVKFVYRKIGECPYIDKIIRYLK